MPPLPAVCIPAPPPVVEPPAPPPDPLALLGELQTAVSGLKPSDLRERVEHAKSDLSSGDTEKALDRLDGFLKKVETLRGKKDMPDSRANDLVGKAQAIIDLIAG